MAACIEDPKTIIEPTPRKYTAGGLPSGGTTGQVLTKASDADGDAVWASGGGSGAPVVVDTALSTTSTNPVQNRVITNALNAKANTTALNSYVQKEAGKGLSANDYTSADKAIVDGVTTALNGKVDKVTGKGLSTNDFTNAYKAKLDSLEEMTAVPTSEVEGWLAA